MKDIDRDPHLSAALRHAPDAGLSAPADISAQILAAAHRAAAERAQPPRPGRFFAQPWRLGASGAFASVLLAGIVGLLWRGEPAPGPAVERTAEVAPAAAPAPATVVAAAPAAEAVPTASAAALAPAPSAERRPALQARQPANAPAPAVVNDAASPTLSAPTLSAPAPATPPAPALTPAADRFAAEAAAARTARAELSPALGRQQAAAPAAVMAVPRPEGPWMEALADGQAVQWRVDGQVRAPNSNWLHALAANTQGRWRPASGVPPAGWDNEVQWWRGGVLQGRLWLGPQGVLWCDALRARCEEAVLAEHVSITLRKGLTR